MRRSFDPTPAQRCRLRHSGMGLSVRRRILYLLMGSGSPIAGAPGLAAQAPSSPTGSLLPFPVGEVLTYRVHVSLGGNIGQGQMRIEGPVMERGVSTWQLVSEMQARRGFVRASDRTVSWVDPDRFHTRRFEKREKQPLASREERVEIDLASGTWRGAEALAHPLASADPLDELSFLYFLRTLPLDRDTTFRFTRHFDAERNPTLVSVGGEELVETPLGVFQTRTVVMHVRDPRHYQGIGLIKLNIDLSPCRFPVRIVSRMPIVGTTTLTLTQRHATACD